MSRVVMVVLSQYPGDPRVRREAEALARRGHAIDIICYRNPDQTSVEQFGSITAHRIMRVRDKTSLLRYLLFSQGFGLAAFWKLESLARRHRYAAVQVHNMPDQLVLTAVLQRLRGVPVVLDLHDLMVELFASKWSGLRARLLLPLVRLVERASCAFATRLITTSIGFQEQLLGRGVDPGKLTLVLNAADDRIFFRPPDGVMERHERRGQRLEQPHLVYTGTVAHRFGVQVLIEAASILKHRGYNPMVHIHGKYDADHRIVLEHQIADLGLEPHVMLGAYLAHEEIRDLLSGMDIGVVPYLQDSFMDLALSTKTFEYIAMELPVVSSRVAAMTSLFSDASLRYFAPNDSADLAAQIQFFCDNPAARESYPSTADVEYAGIAWSVMEQRYVELMEGLMGGKKAPDNVPGH